MRYSLMIWGILGLLCGPAAFAQQAAAADYSCRRRETTAEFLPHYQVYVDPIMYSYAELFDFVRGDQLLAESIGRFVPWVKTPQDVVRLIDVYLV